MEKWHWSLVISEESPEAFYDKLAKYFLDDYKNSMFGANIDYVDSEEIEEMAEEIKKSLVKHMNKVERLNCESGKL